MARHPGSRTTRVYRRGALLAGPHAHQAAASTAGRVPRLAEGAAVASPHARRRIAAPGQTAPSADATSRGRWGVAQAQIWAQQAQTPTQGEPRSGSGLGSGSGDAEDAQRLRNSNPQIQSPD
eukprot:gene19112-biopygen16026